MPLRGTQTKFLPVLALRTSRITRTSSHFAPKRLRTKFAASIARPTERKQYNTAVQPASVCILSIAETDKAPTLYRGVVGLAFQIGIYQTLFGLTAFLVLRYHIYQFTNSNYASCVYCGLDGLSKYIHIHRAPPPFPAGHNPPPAPHIRKHTLMVAKTSARLQAESRQFGYCSDLLVTDAPT